VGIVEAVATYLEDWMFEQREAIAARIEIGLMRPGVAN
jgi:hypothetical protein